jgi:hypothetical protein
MPLGGRPHVPEAKRAVPALPRHQRKRLTPDSRLDAARGNAGAHRREDGRAPPRRLADVAGGLMMTGFVSESAATSVEDRRAGFASLRGADAAWQCTRSRSRTRGTAGRRAVAVVKRAGRVGFEPTRPVRVCRFSRPERSTTPPPAQDHASEARPRDPRKIAQRPVARHRLHGSQCESEQTGEVGVSEGALQLRTVTLCECAR